jgi:predicted amidophosphoribosyltransferase
MSGSCKKCLRGPLSVHVLSSGLCQECQSEIEWKRGPHIVRQQKMQKIKHDHFKKGEAYIKRKWKEKYGDDNVEAVLEYK